MKTKEQIKAMAYNYSQDNSDAFIDRKEASVYAYQEGYKAAQRDAEEREAKLVEALRFYANEENWCLLPGSIQMQIVFDENDVSKAIDFGLVGGKRARETLKELGLI